MADRYPDLKDQSLSLADASPGFLRALIGDGRSLIHVTALCLILAGAFAIFQSATGHFLPHDTEFLKMSPQDLCSINECRIVHFMFHDRVSFGGSLIAIGILYLWISEFPLKAGQPWAWYALALSGITGFGSFVSYLGYGYLDTWHAAATLALLPCFLSGMWIARRTIFSRVSTTSDSQHSPESQNASSCDTISVDISPNSWRCLLRQHHSIDYRSRHGLGLILLLLTGIGLVGAGTTILTLGMTFVFVPSDLVYMDMTYSQLDAVNPRLIPLIAHDRAGFGGGVATAGLLLLACIWCGGMTRPLWQALLLCGIVGWTTSIGVHPVIGYNDGIHLAPPVLGAILYTLGLILTRRQAVSFPSGGDQPSQSRPQ